MTSHIQENIELVTLTIDSAIFLHIVWSLASSHLYRHPEFIAILGVILGITGWYISFLLGNHQNPKLANSKDIITILISSLSGSLFVSALILKAQRANSNSLTKADVTIDKLENFYETIRELEENLKREKDTMSEEEFRFLSEVARQRKYITTSKIIKEKKRKERHKI